MNVYCFNYKGSYLGGEMTVIAIDESHARSLAEDALSLDYKGIYKGQDLELDYQKPFFGYGVVHNWDGDY